LKTNKQVQELLKKQLIKNHIQNFKKKKYASGVLEVHLKHTPTIIILFKSKRLLRKIDELFSSNSF